MIRFLVVIPILISLSVVVDLLGFKFGPLIMMGGFFVIFILPMLMYLPRVKLFQTAIDKWLEENGPYYKYVKPELKFWRSKLRWKTSDGQLVFLLENGNTEIWFVCGNPLCQDSCRLT